MDPRLTALGRSLLLLSEVVQGSPEAIADHLGRSRVQIVASKDALADPSTQAAIATVSSILARTGIGLEASFPHVVVQTLLLHGADLQSAVTDLVSRSFPDSYLGSPSECPDITLVIGDVSPLPQGRVLWLVADGQRAGFRFAQAPWQPADALVALAAAAMTAAEATRHVLRGLPPVSRSAAAELALLGSAEIEIPAIPSGMIRLGSWDCISAGAITNSLIWTFLARGDIDADIRVFDDGRYDASNLNRYFLLDTHSALAELGKVEHLAGLPLLSGLRLTPVFRRFSVEDVLTARAQIMIGADDIRARHTAQQSGPEYLAIAATSHFEVRLTQHFRGGPCAGCAHPYYNELDDSLIPTLATVSFWAGLQLALFVLARACGSEVPQDHSYATYWPLRPGSGVAGPVLYHPLCKLGHGRKDDAA
jgi:hypothetical protein